MHSPQIDKMTNKLSNVSNILSKIVNEIEEKAKEKALLQDLTAKLRHETIRVREDVQKIHKEQQEHYANSAKTVTKVTRHNDLTKDVGKNLDACKKSVVILGEKVEKDTAENEGIKLEILREKELINELTQMIKKMKAEIVTQKKEADNMRKNCGSSAKQCEILQAKIQKMQLDIDQFYHVAKTSGVC